MATRIRTINFLPDIFKTPTNAQFLGATLDQIVDQPNTMTIEGFVGSKFGYGVNANDKYVVETTKTRRDYQLEPGVVFTKNDSQIAQDFISYPGIIDALKLEGGVTDNNDRLFNSQFYSWDPFINLDMLINFNQYYWLPTGAPAVQVIGDININDDILGKVNYTSPNGVTFTNGLKVEFSGTIFPTSYESGQYYVQGIGSAIELLPTTALLTPEGFTESIYNPYDIAPYDIGNFDQQLYIPVMQDYITIARNSIDKNPWSRSNRWFHIDVINATAEYNNDPTIATTYATLNNKAKRPIIEFYPNLKLFDTGVVGKAAIDFMDFRTTDAFTQVAGQENFYPDVEVYTGYAANIAAAVSSTTTTITVSNTEITGTFKVGQYINDTANVIPYTPVLPSNTQIIDITSSAGVTTLTVEWGTATSFSAVNNISLAANNGPNSNYSLFPGARIIFANDPLNKDKIFVAQFSIITPGSTPIITLTIADDGNVLPDEQTVAIRGYNNQGKDFYYTNLGTWQESQQKTTVNQPPKFDIFDADGISFGNKEIYIGTSFVGTTLFEYGRGSGLIDKVLGFPIRYSSVSNTGDISFDVTLNSDTFNCVLAGQPKTINVNSGYVYNYSSINSYSRQIGWQTAVAPSRQYQIFTFNYTASNQTTTFVCDIAAETNTIWPNVQVYINNVLTKDGYTVTIDNKTTTITFTNPPSDTDTVIEITVLSDQVSKTAYYQVPINLTNNPLNQNLTTLNVGDIRGQYQSIFYNNPNTTGNVFGSNNYRDLGNMVPWGNRIIQNSASLVLPSVFSRKQNQNLIFALQYNSEQYITYKTLLIDTINNTEYSAYQTPAYILDDAIEQISAAKFDSAPFFWSDMLPSKASYASKTYTFANALDTSTYPLSKIYDFNKANYNGVLVYLTRNQTTSQLIKGVDYTVSNDSPSLTITLDLLPNDLITINEYNQTYGSYVPNTPTKLGLYPSFVPGVVLDPNYSQPTYFIRGHDGSYTKLYGDYIDGKLIDFRDKALLEFESRIYNNLKLGNTQPNVIPVRDYDVIPGFFRTTDYSYDEVLSIYSQYFLNWAGQNRIDFSTQRYNSTNQFTFNYNQSGNKIDQVALLQGYWRGIYQYFYDTSNPDTTPWEMLFFTSMPTWWETRYGPAPYTSDNLVLWGDLAAGINWNNGDPVIIPEAVRPQLLQVIPVDSAGNLLSPFDAVMGNYTQRTFRNDWKVGDVGPAEFAYRRSSSWPFDLMKILALTKPAEFYNLGVDIDNYKYNAEFNQFLVNDRSHLVIDDIQIYGSGIAKTSYINWIVDYEKQVGIDATSNITSLLYNLDVRLVYRLAGFSDKTLLKFFVEKGTPNSRNASLLIPDESYAVLLYENQPYDRIIYSSVIVQKTINGWKVFGNSQNKAYFTIKIPKINGNYSKITIDDLEVQIAKDYYESSSTLVPYGQEFYSIQQVAQFLASYGNYLFDQGVLFDQIESGIQVDWAQMVAEYLYWAQSGWEVGSIINLNPSANTLAIDKESYVVQPLTLQRQNFVLNQNLYPIQSMDLAVVRDGTLFTATPLNQGDTVAYGQFNISNIEHGIVFDNVTLFNDILYNLVTGLKQNRIFVRGTKSAEWNGTIDAQGFILNQDNIQEWSREVKYTKGAIVKYKNKYWTSIKIVQAKEIFDETDWIRTDYNEIQKGLLPNSSTRSYESTLYYNVNKANLENDADLLSFSLIGYRPRDYLALADLTDITQVNVYKNLLKEKGTRIAVSLFKGAQLPQGGIDYDVYENWAIKTGEFGGVLNSNFVDFKLNQSLLTGNPSIVGLTSGQYTNGVQQSVPLYSIINYGRPITTPNVLPTLPVDTPPKIFPSAGYVNFNDIKVYSYFYSGLNSAEIPLSQLYVGEYVWIADYQGTWQVYTPISIGQVINVINNLNGTATVQFDRPHALTKYQPFAIISFDSAVNGYYIVTSIISNDRVTITLALNPAITNITGEGVAVKFQNARVTKPSDIPSLPLSETEFVKNKIWVDENTDGNWGVYRKSINYQLENQIEKLNSSSFGNAVAFSEELGYLISDATIGEVYRYTFNPIFNQYSITETLSTGTTTFGTTIEHAGSTIIISQPTSSPLVNVYKLKVSLLQNELVFQQTINAPAGITNWGSAIAISGDEKWLFVSAFENNLVFVYSKSLITGQYQLSSTLSLNSIVPNDNFGYALSTDYYGTTVVISAPNKDFNATTDNWGYVYVFDRLVQSFEAVNPQAFNLVFSTNTTQIGVTQSYSSNNEFTCNSTSSLSIGSPVIFTGAIFGNINANTTYYVSNVSSSTTFSVSANLNTTTANTSTNSAVITLDDVANLVVNNPIIFYGDPGNSNIEIGFAYTISSANVANSTITISGNTNPISNSIVDLSAVSPSTTLSLIDEPFGSMDCYPQTYNLYVSKNGVDLTNQDYGAVGNQLTLFSTYSVGDIITVSSQNFVYNQTLTTETTPKTGAQFGYSVDTNIYGTEILVGAPFEINENNMEGAVYRFTNSGGKYGSIIGTFDCNVQTPTTILLNGYAVSIPAGNAAIVANAIIQSNITNITAADNNGVLVIGVINVDLATINDKLSLSVLDSSVLSQLGILPFTQTQIINDIHPQGRTQFGTTIKFNEFGSFVVSAPVATRFSSTTFDFSDDENYDNDTVFDNNTTRWVDDFTNAGAVYMYDYLSVYNESINNVGKFVYAQSINNNNLDYGAQPYYGTALDFNENKVLVGTPNFKPGYSNGQVVIYDNATGVQDWKLYRYSAPIVDVEKIQNTQLYSVSTNNTLINLDYIDPLQGKILGAVRQNIDIVSNVDPAQYNSPNSSSTGGAIWGIEQVGKLWYNTSTTRFVNYHQNDDVQYNSKWWARPFPGSDIKVYSWISSNVLPIAYTGPGTPLDFNSYCTSYSVSSTGALVPVYFYWVRNTNLVFTKIGKTLSDTICESYIAAPIATGISYMAPIQPNVFGLYNTTEYVNAMDTVLHIGFATGNNDDISHSSYTLIQSNNPEDFLPGVPGDPGVVTPESLYDRQLDSLSGVDEQGAVVPDPYLPKPVQSGIYVRPRQSFFYNRFKALENYLKYANEVLKNYPISETTQFPFLFEKNPIIYGNDNNGLIDATEIRKGYKYKIVTIGSTDYTTLGAASNTIGLTFIANDSSQYTQAGEIIGSGTGTANWILFEEGEKYNTENYWEYIYWWAEGYDNNTKSALLVPLYANLSEIINPQYGLIVTVAQNGNGNQEVYRYQYDAVIDGGVWARIGLENGTIKFKETLWNYNVAKLGFGDNFFDVLNDPFDNYPSEETRYIVRALNEQIYVQELLEYRNKSLILLFEYIISETIESQNYLPWLNKTSFIDVAHTIRELLPLQVFKSDNQDFLAGYINEAKPYHVVIKDFVFKYTGQEIWGGTITDFDLPAQYNSNLGEFISPMMAYNSYEGDNQYLYDNTIWETPSYKEWYNNYGLSITGQANYPITTLASYVSLAEDSLYVSNAQGFPVRGQISIRYFNAETRQIEEEKIGYTGVDYSINRLYGLFRGAEDTTVVTHYPGAEIFIDLPPVVLVNGGRGYTTAPNITAQIDTSVFPEPRVAAEFEAIMENGSIIGVNVINPGQGYYELPEIVIDSSFTVSFTSDDIDINLNIVGLNSASLQTGDLVKYTVGTGTTTPAGLQENQYYYVGVLQSVPSDVIAFYNTLDDAIFDSNRIPLLTQGLGSNNLISVTAKAFAVTNSQPVRENIITLRFDRTSYTSKIIPWEAGQFYGSYYAGLYTNSSQISSSSITLETTQPNVANLLASAQGAVLEIQNITNNQVVTWSSLPRLVANTYSTGNIITIESTANGAVTSNSIGPTTGFYTDMPVQFTGNVIGGLSTNTVYYVSNVSSLSNITISTTVGGPEVALSDASANTANSELIMQIGEVINTGIITINYPGILTVTETQANNNSLISPLTPTGQGGTTNMYIGVPVFFVNSTTGNVFGNIVENEVYYVNTILDNQSFILSKTNNPVILDVVSANSTNNTITVSSTSTTNQLSVNDPIIFQDMIYTIGNLIIGQEFTIQNAGTTDFTQFGAVSNVVGTTFTANGTGLVTSVITGLDYTIETVGDTNWTSIGASANTVGTTFTSNSTTSLGTGIAIQGDGIVSSLLFGGIASGNIYYVNSIANLTTFTLSESINGLEFTITNDVSANATITSQVNALSLTNATGNMIMNIGSPLSPGQINGQLFNFYATSGNVTSNVTGNIGNLLSRTINSTVLETDSLIISNASGGLNYLYSGLQFNVNASVGGLTPSVDYSILSLGNVSITGLTTANTVTNSLVCANTVMIYEGMPVTFTGIPVGGITLGQEYYVKNIVPNTSFTLSEVQYGNTLVLTSTLGLMDLLGEPYITIAGGSITSSSTQQYTLSQSTNVMTPVPTFNVGYVLGGYAAYIEESSQNFVVNNTITIDGSLIGGTSGTNDLTITINEVDANGSITNISKSGIPAGNTGQYYLKVISSNECAVYADPLFTIPVSGIELEASFSGIITTDATATTAVGNVVTVSDTSAFSVNDAVIFTGYLGNAFGGLNVGQTYYIRTIDSSTTLTLTTETFDTAGPLPNPVEISNDTIGSYLMSKSGSFAFLPEPFYFDQSIVQYRNKVYRCVVSNNDTDFQLGKWELVQSDSRYLNALDRIQGYYQPTINMPGKDMAQLVSGIIYPNSTYLDNAFAPEDQFSLDTELSDVEFTGNTAATIYTVQGDEFLAGYGPEELVPGIVTDNLTMIVTTRPGTTWPVTVYEHVGYRVASTIIAPTVANQTNFSFDNIVEIPAEVAVFLVDSTTGLSTRLNENTITDSYDYSVDWVNKLIILNSIIPSTQSLQIDVYEVGNGDQLVKSDSEITPVLTSETTNFGEIALNCNYSGGRATGSGIVIPSTVSTQVEAFETDSSNNQISCVSVSSFTLNAPITFQGDVFGGVASQTTYYVKTINTVTNQISISDSISLGVAGPTFSLTDDTGSMQVITQVGNGLVWTEPVVMHNGRKLTLGEQSIVTETKNDGTIVCNSTSQFVVGEPIVFSKDIDLFGTPIVANQTYYIESIIDDNEFTISATVGGSVITLINATGIALCLTSDYAVSIADIGITAKLVLSNSLFTTLDSNGVPIYDPTIDYISYTVFGETEPIQYGYTLPESQVFTANSNSTYDLVNFVGGTNPENAIVELNGLRTTANYSIDASTNSITFSGNISGQIVSVTTFNDTNRQYLHTQYDITGNQVNQIINIDNSISSAIAVTGCTATNSVGNIITCTSTTGFVVGQTVTFTGTSVGGVQTDGTVYFIKSFGVTSFVIEDDTGTEIGLSTDTGAMTAYIGARPAVRVTTSTSHNFVTNDIVRIDGVFGSTQLNNNIYYVHYITNDTFDLYNGPYSTNDPVTVVSTYVSGGYVWLNNTFTLITTTANATSSIGNLITVANRTELTEDTPVYFSGNVFGGVASGTTYYIKDIVDYITDVTTSVSATDIFEANDTTGFEPDLPIIFTGNVFGGITTGTTYYVKTVVSPTEFTISTTPGGSLFALSDDSGSMIATVYTNYITVTDVRGGEEYSLSTSTGNMNLTQWEQLDVERLYVTINGYRVPSTSLRLNPNNELSILAPITVSDSVTITNMIPSATPNEMIYIQNVNKFGESSVYRINALTKSWLSSPLYDTDLSITVNDISKVTTQIIQNESTPAPVDGIYSIGLDADKHAIVQVVIYNNSTGFTVSPDFYSINLISAAPVVEIIDGVSAGDNLTITVIVGNILYVNGEQIKFGQVDIATNTISSLSRGYNGTGVNPYLPEYTTVYGILSPNKLDNEYYTQTWNSYIYNQIQGDPLQVSQTSAALFLNNGLS